MFFSGQESINFTRKHYCKGVKNIFDIKALEDFYKLISAKDGIDIAKFQTTLENLFERPRSEEDLNKYRLSREPWKKLADEVSPVSRFLQYQGIEVGRVRFPLDSKPPDCWLWKTSEEEPVGIEVTIARGRERYHLSKELVETGTGRGFVGLSDNAPQAAFDEAMARQRTTYNTDHALSAMEEGVSRCLAQKNRPEFAGHILVIAARLHALKEERWQSIESSLCAKAQSLPFREVHVICEIGQNLWGFQIK